MSDKLSRKRSLESLKKEAKRWFGALRRNIPDARTRFERLVPEALEKPTLRDVQHALALEHGFSGWTELKHKLTAGAEETTRALGQFEDMAEALLEAYRTGTPAAMERHWALTWHRRNWQAMRTYVQLDLGRQAGAIDQNDDITLDDARFLVAREHGFERWDALVKFYSSVPVLSSIITTKPVRVLAAETVSDESSSWQSRDWSAVVARLKEGDATGIDADGQMTDVMLEDVSRIEQITTLKLGGSKSVTDAGVSHLARLSRLRHLDLSGTGITDRGLEVLRALPELETVSLAWTKVTDTGVAHLSGCEHLSNVNLQGTSSGDEALRALAGKARLCQLRTGNAVTDAGLALLHEIPIFKSWHGGEPKMGLLSYDAGPNYLLLRGPFTDRGMTQLEGLDGLFALNLDASELGITAAGLAPLVGLPELGWLAVDATDDSMPYIARMPRLRFLGCQDTVAGDDGFVSLSRSQSIEYIWGRRCYNLRTRGFAALPRMPTLRGLSVSCKNVEDAGVAELPNLRALRELMPMDVPDEGYRHIARCEALESLILMYCRETSDAATEHIVRLPQLKDYFASYTRITDRTPELLSHMDSLERITLDGCAGVTNAGLAHLARLPRLRELRVSGPQITSEIVSHFPSRVRVHYSV
jgi:Leucine Rich repeat